MGSAAPPAPLPGFSRNVRLHTHPCRGICVHLEKGSPRLELNGPDAANDERVPIIRPRVLESAADASYVPLQHGGIFTARVQDMAEWARANSMWPALFGLACCAIEMMSVSASRWDIARFGAEAFRASP